MNLLEPCTKLAAINVYDFSINRSRIVRSLVFDSSRCARLESN